MLTEEDVISQFIEDCTSLGIKNPQKICERMLSRVEEIDGKIREADLLRPEKQKLLEFVKEMGFAPPKKKRPVPIKEGTRVEDLDAKDVGFAIQICEYIAKNGAVEPRALMKVCGVSLENDHQVYNIIKWLGTNGICARDKDNNVIQGPNWAQRPVSA